jgi:predicted ATPase
VVVLATSREPLGLAGERVHAVSSLDPVLEGVVLFCERAAAADDAFVCDDTDSVVIGEICARLDGIPLAIELAAARVRSMTPTDVLARLDDRFRVLRGGGRGGVERHQTLRAAVAWSYQLLSEPERVAFERVSVFAGGFDLAAAAACVDTEADIDDAEAADVLASLVDKSMLTVDRSSRSSRYRMLETLRQYGEERLGERGAAVLAHDRHFAHYRTVAERASAAFTGPRQLDALHTTEREWDNLRAAFDWAQTTGDGEGAIALALACARCAQTSARFEHRQWIDALLATTPEDHVSRCSLYGKSAMWATLAGDFDLALRLGQLGASAAEGCPDQVSAVFCWGAQAIAHSTSGRASDALAALRTAESLVGDDDYAVGSWLQMAVGVSGACDPAAGPSLRARFRELASAREAPLWSALAVSMTGFDLLARTQFREARDAFQEALRLSGDIHGGSRAATLTALALIATAINDNDTTKVLHEALSDVYATHFWGQVWGQVENVGLHWMRTGTLEPAAVALGYVDAHGHAHAIFGASGTEVLAILDAHPELTDARARGAAMTRDQVVTYVLDQLNALGGP